MLSPRQRVLSTLQYKSPDRLPVFFHPSTAGLYTHGPKLLDLFNRYPCDNPITFTHIPQPEATCFDPDGRFHEFKTDEWNITWEYRLFGVQGHPHKYPFANWQEAATYQFPPVAQPGYPDLTRRLDEMTRWKHDYYVVDGWATFFMQLYAMYPMEQLLMDLMDRDPYLLAFIPRMADHWQRVIRNLLDTGADAIMFADDWCTQTGPMVPREIYRELFAPHYATLMQQVRDAGKQVFFHMCGRPGYMLEELEALPVDGLWPQIACYEPHAEFAQRLKDHAMTTYLHPDRQHLVPHGTPAQIERQIATYAEIHHRLGGGAIFWIEIEHDAPFENVEALLRAVDKYR